MFKLAGPLSPVQEGSGGLHSLVAQDVVVLAPNFTLTEPQRKLLNKGLFFIPALGIGRDQKLNLLTDIQNYHRKIKLAIYFEKSPRKQKLPFLGCSHWSPHLNQLPPEVGQLIREDTRSFKKHFTIRTEKQNISLAEVKALRDLQHSKHIVIKPADKGSAVVILSREQYIYEVKRQLQDTTYYKKLDQPMYLETIPMVEDIVNSLKAKKFINTKQRDYLIGESEPRVRRFYILPKIHKDPDKWTVPYQIPPGRPIVSDCGSETYYTAQYLDFYLNPLSVLHPAYVKDTYDFIEIVKNLRIPPDSHFFSMDVDNLYTNIPISAGISCVKKMFEKHPDPKRPDEELLQLLKINLTRNDFMFNDESYLQVKGTAMGKRFAPAYANIYMANWETEAFQKCPKKPACYVRYLDDIWGIWSGSLAEFEEFFNILNTHDPSITLKKEINPQFINFLDTTVYKGPNFINDNKLDIKVYFKSTDTHALLHKHSFHPKHTFRGIVKSQLLRFKRICTRTEDFFEAVKVLFKALRRRGYSRSFLRHSFRTFHDGGRPTRGDLIPLITTFSSNSRLINRKLKNNFDMVLNDTGLIPNSSIISAYRRNRNLSDLLVRAKLPSLQSDRRSLVLQPQFVKLRFVRNLRENTLFKIKQEFSMHTRNCVYLIFCCKCGVKYVGETQNTLSTRMFQHRYNIRNHRKVDTPLVGHFLTHGLAALRIAGLQKDANWTDWERKKKERLWIYLLGTRMPWGLNVGRR